MATSAMVASQAAAVTQGGTGTCSLGAAEAEASPMLGRCPSCWGCDEPVVSRLACHHSGVEVPKIAPRPPSSRPGRPRP